MSNKIKVQPQNLNRIRVGDQTSIQIISSQVAANIDATQQANSLLGLSDIDQNGLQDNYVLQYDATSQKFKFVDPDQILQDAVPGGIPGDFINVLDTDPNRTDNIDFDGGSF
jgi:hypothetical protein